jgi:hypothetical protein
VADPLVTADDLTRLLEQLAIERGHAQTGAQASDAQIELLVARITLLTEALRGAAAGDAARLAARLLVADLAQVTAQFRGRTNWIRAALESAIEEMRAALGPARAAPDQPS